jgi:hypothetical protein
VVALDSHEQMDVMRVRSQIEFLFAVYSTQSSIHTVLNILPSPEKRTRDQDLSNVPPQTTCALVDCRLSICQQTEVGHSLLEVCIVLLYSSYEF